jgi:hypothetical protein
MSTPPIGAPVIVVRLDDEPRQDRLDGWVGRRGLVVGIEPAGSPAPYWVRIADDEPAVICGGERLGSPCWESREERFEPSEIEELYVSP